MNGIPLEETPTARRATVYNSVFWTSYTANVALVMANALTFRFAELVAYLGGTEKMAGAIVGTGVLGALIVRLGLGQAIDRFGTRKLWMLSALLFIVGSAVFVVCRELSWELYAARMAFSAGLAGMFTCSIVHIQNQVPPERRTEVIGSLGSSGFVGMIFGTQAGDAIFNGFPAGNARFVALFGGATALGFVYLLLISRLTQKDVHVAPRETPPAHRLLMRYWPGFCLLGALMMGMGVAVWTVFLTRFTTHLQASGHDVSGIGTFFTGYAASAFVFRIGTRRWSRTVGRHRMILAGLAGHCVGNFLLPGVTTEWGFIIPSIACGWGHALLFPSVISLGAGAFPSEYRGSGTTLVLGFTELGAMLSAPILGGIIDYFTAHYGAQIGFTAMFYTSAATAFSMAVVYAVATGRVVDNDGRIESDPPVIAPKSAMTGTMPAPAEVHDEPSPEPAAFPLPQPAKQRVGAVEMRERPSSPSQKRADATCQFGPPAGR